MRVSIFFSCAICATAYRARVVSLVSSARLTRPQDGRFLNIREYQAKELLKKYGVAVLDGGVAFTADEVVAVAQSPPGPVYVEKPTTLVRGAGHLLTSQPRQWRRRSRCQSLTLCAMPA